MTHDLVGDLMHQVHLLEQRLSRLKAENVRLRAELGNGAHSVGGPIVT